MSIELKGLDAEIFMKNLNRELSQDEIDKIREWALAPKVLKLMEKNNLVEDTYACTMVQ